MVFDKVSIQGTTDQKTLPTLLRAASAPVITYIISRVGAVSVPVDFGVAKQLDIAEALKNVKELKVVVNGTIPIFLAFDSAAALATKEGVYFIGSAKVVSRQEQRPWYALDILGSLASPFALRRISRFFTPKVYGAPSSDVEFVEQGLCRFRWIFALWLPLAVLSWIAMMHDLNRLSLMTASIAHGLMVLPVGLVLSSGARASLRRARLTSCVAVLFVLAGAGLIIGASGFYPGYIGGFGFAFAVVLGFAPLETALLVFLFLFGLSSTVAAFLSTGGSLWSTPHAVSLITPICLGALAISLNRWSYKNHRQLTLSRLRLLRQTRELDREKKRADQLLERALTRPVAEELRRHKAFQPTTAEVCVIETDILHFSSLCERVPTRVVLQELQRFSKAFETCCLAYNVQPLHTWGDANVAVAGLGWEPDIGRRIPEVDCGLAMLDLCRRMMAADDMCETPGTAIWPARVGIHCGPVMMAVLDGARLRFDIWGETVNIAARLEQGARPNTIHVSDKFLIATRGLFDHGPIREVEVKNTVIRAAELYGIKAAFRDELEQPNEAFWSTYFDEDFGVCYPNPEGTQSLERTHSSSTT